MISHGEKKWFAIYTKAGSEKALASTLDSLDGVEPFLPLDEVREAGRDRSFPLLFNNYVFLGCTLLTAGLKRTIQDFPNFEYWVGTRRNDPSEIPSREISILCEVGRKAYNLEHSVYPTKGRIVEVISGPMEGLQGIIAERRGKRATICTTLPVVGRICELKVPIDLLEMRGYHNQLASRPRHRAGKRGRKQKNVA